MDSRLNLLRIIVGVTALFAIAFYSSTAIVRQGSATIVTRLGEASRVVVTPGLHFTLPWPIEDTISIDTRRRSFETRHTEMLTGEGKNIILLSYVVWRVEDPLLFYRSIGAIDSADEALDGMVTNAKNGILGRYKLVDLISVAPATTKVEQIERELLQAVQPAAIEQYGIFIEDVGFSRLSLPQANVAAVFKQMRAERKTEAANYQIAAEQNAREKRSQTDLEVASLEASALEDSEKIRGNAEAQAAKIYAEAYGQDPDLYRFIRSLDSLDEVIGSRSTVILRTDSEPFWLLSTSTPGAK